MGEIARLSVIAESLARVIAAIRIASVRWRSYFSPKHRISPHRPCVCCAAIRIARLAFIRLTFVPRGIAEWLARVDRVRWTLAIGDLAHLRWWSAGSRALGLPVEKGVFMENGSVISRDSYHPPENVCSQLNIFLGMLKICSYNVQLWDNDFLYAVALVLFSWHSSQYAFAAFKICGFFTLFSCNLEVFRINVS